MKTIDQIILEDNQRVLVEYLPNLSESFGGKMRGIASPLMFAPIMILAPAMLIKIALHRSKARKILEQGISRCDRYSGSKKAKCMQDVRKVVAENNIRELEKAKGECNKNKDPDKRRECQRKIEERIAKERVKVQINRRGFGWHQATAEFGY